MANTVFIADQNKDPVRQKIRALSLIKEGVQLLASQRAIEIQRRGDTDGSSDSHYAALATAGSFQAGNFATANEAARKAFEKLDDLYFKLTTNGSVTDVSNAINDTCAQFEV